MPRTVRCLPPPSRRAGFTLIELLVVVIIIGILVALLVPAIAGAVRAANDARVTAEINTMSQALASFNSQYGVYPPSRIMISESLDLANYPTGNSAGLFDDSSGIVWNTLDGNPTTKPSTYFYSSDITVGALAQRSVTFLRKVWPRLGIPNTNNTLWHDINGNGQKDAGFILLDGAECLAFFLGGIPTKVTNPQGGFDYGMTGFGRDPQFPFKAPGSGALMITDSRTKPYFEFRAERLADNDGDGIPGYLDALGSKLGDGRFYAYYCAYGNNSYDPNDCNLIYFGAFADTEDISLNTFQVFFPTKNRASGYAGGIDSPGPNPYTTTLPVPASASQSVTYTNKQSFQIISPGRDRLYGCGGQYAPDAGDRLPGDQTIRVAEKDNLTNFHNSKLD